MVKIFEPAVEKRECAAASGNAKKRAEFRLHSNEDADPRKDPGGAAVHADFGHCSQCRSASFGVGHHVCAATPSMSVQRLRSM